MRETVKLHAPMVEVVFGVTYPETQVDEGFSHQTLEQAMRRTGHEHRGCVVVVSALGGTRTQT